METKCTIELPFYIGETVKVSSKTLPTKKIDMEENEIPEFFNGRIVSFRMNGKSKYFKIAIRAPWYVRTFYAETGWEEAGENIEKYFTYPLSAINKTVFLNGGGKN